ncbi:unnamed protein product [Adineta ricciae]|uniref:G-protein coupled receptors family 1 profile domain-containing protein n=1 Tax=Adineta ricciae TaxID=249248 RepID=A0A815N6N7_ADIRI|nr:unnamed protein product [Adineta ricciae]
MLLIDRLQSGDVNHDTWSDISIDGTDGSILFLLFNAYDETFTALVRILLFQTVIQRRNMSLIYIAQQITIYGGCCILIAGVFGNAIDIYIFSVVPSYRRNPAIFYFRIASITNIIFLMIHLSIRIALGFGIDVTRISTSWCKSRTYLLYSLAMIVLSCICMAMIDQFLVTSRHVKLRNLSNIRWAHRLVIIIIIIGFLHAIPAALFYDILPTTGMCEITNSNYATYRSAFLLGTLTLIPIIVTLLFGYLTYRNIHSVRALAEQHADQHIVRMTLFQVVLVNVCLIPYGIIVTYSYITKNQMKDASRLIHESFIVSLLTLWDYGYYSVTCYVFFISSPKFRRAIRDRILFCRSRNQIGNFGAA